MLQTLLWSRMTCSSTVLKYPLAVLAQTPAAYILMYCHAFSTTFTAVRCFQLRKKYWDWTLPRIRAQKELSITFVYYYKMSTSGSSARSSHLTQGGRKTMMTIGIFRIIAEWYLLFFAKFRSHRLKIEKVMTENLSQLNALVLITEPVNHISCQIHFHHSRSMQSFQTQFVLVIFSSG